MMKWLKTCKKHSTITMLFSRIVKNITTCTQDWVIDNERLNCAHQLHLHRLQAQKKVTGVNCEHTPCFYIQHQFKVLYYIHILHFHVYRSARSIRTYYSDILLSWMFPKVNTYVVVSKLMSKPKWYRGIEKLVIYVRSRNLRIVVVEGVSIVVHFLQITCQLHCRKAPVLHLFHFHPQA